MRVKVFSDLHIGDKDKSDNFRINEDTLISYLEDCLKKYDKVVINGDIFECWESESFDAQEKQFQKVKEAYPKLVNYLACAINSSVIIATQGNHDYIVGRNNLIENIEKSFIINNYSTLLNRPVVIYIAHGHEADVWNSKISWVGKTVAWVYGWAQRLGFKNEALELNALINRVQGGDTQDDFCIYAKKKAQKYNYDGIVFGHTHTARIDGIYANCGCCTEKTNIESLDIIIEDDTGIITYTIEEK